MLAKQLGVSEKCGQDDKNRQFWPNFGQNGKIGRFWFQIFHLPDVGPKSQFLSILEGVNMASPSQNRVSKGVRAG